MSKITKIKVDRRIFEDTIVTEEMIFRDLAKKFINEISFDELTKLLKFNKLDPHSNDNEYILKYNIDCEHKEEIVDLKIRNLISYSVEDPKKSCKHPKDKLSHIMGLGTIFCHECKNIIEK